MYGGRAKRIETLKRAAIFLVCVIVIFISVKYVKREEVVYDTNANYALLKNYFISRGFSCGLLERNGSKCSLNKDNVEYSFYRFNDGFSYYINSDSYSLAIIHVKSSGSDEVRLSTNNNALVNFRDKDFVCTMSDGVLSEIKQCVDDEGNDINGTYKGVVEKGIVDVNNALNISGYKIDVLMKDYTWVRAN